MYYQKSLSGEQQVIAGIMITARTFYDYGEIT